MKFTVIKFNQVIIMSDDNALRVIRENTNDLLKVNYH